MRYVNLRSWVPRGFSLRMRYRVRRYGSSSQRGRTHMIYVFRPDALRRDGGAGRYAGIAYAGSRINGWRKIITQDVK